jgi:hypothetical protein
MFLLQLRFLKDTTQLDELIPRLRKARCRHRRGTGKASDVNSPDQAELDEISRENVSDSPPAILHHTYSQPDDSWKESE